MIGRQPLPPPRSLLILLWLMMWGGVFSGPLSATPDDDTEVTLSGEFRQGAIIRGQGPAGIALKLDGQTVPVDDEGRFVLGFDRDAPATASLQLQYPDGSQQQRQLVIEAQDYAIERVDGLPPSRVTPDASVQSRIQQEAARVAAARSRRDAQRADWASDFIWPAHGRLSGFYGSQRILNGEPRRPHYGVDVAAPAGTPVWAPAPGVVTLAEPDLYFSGGTIIIDHGQGLTSSFLHLSAVEVSVGQKVAQGDVIGRIGATGRATGPHLDWRMNWLDRRVNPHSLVTPEPPAL